jgi:hypothetical protein
MMDNSEKAINLKLEKDRNKCFVWAGQQQVPASNEQV